jgi:hypothetical protein
VNSVTYRLVMFRPVAITVLVGLGVIAIALIHNLFSFTDPLLVVFVVLWLGAFAWNAYWFLFRVAYEIGVRDGSTLHWRTLTSRHEAPLARITGIVPPFGRFGNTLRKIAVEGGPSPLVMPAPGVSEVIAMIVAFRPDATVKSSWLDRTAERFALRTVRWKSVGGGGGN